MKRFPSLLLMLSLFAGVAAHAHPKILRIVGTVEYLSEATLTVKTNQGRSFTVVLNNETMFMRDDMPNPSRNLKVRDRVILRVYKRRKHLIAGEIVIETSVVSTSELVLHYSPTLTADAARAIVQLIKSTASESLAQPPPRLTPTYSTTPWSRTGLTW